MIARCGGRLDEYPPNHVLGFIAAPLAIMIPPGVLVIGFIIGMCVLMAVDMWGSKVWAMIRGKRTK